MPKDKNPASVTPAYVMRCGAIQNVSRPMRTCHWMSHCTPQPVTSLAAQSAQNTTRWRASESARTAAAPLT